MKNPVTLAMQQMDPPRPCSQGELVASEHLGLFDTPPNRQEIRLGLTIVGLLFAALLLVFPLRATQLGEFRTFVPLLDSFMLFSDLIVATLLYAQAAVFRSRGLTILASGYLFSALVLVPHALTFPGAFTENGMLGAGVSTTAWLAIFRRLTFPLAVISYALLRSADSVAQTARERLVPRVFEGVIAATVLAGLATLLATSGHDLLPPIFRNVRDTVPTSLVVVNAVTIALTIAAMTMLLRRDKSVLDLWLLVGLSGWLLQSLLNLTLQSRYTVGWYGLNGMTLASSLVLMVALIAESNRLYARLALQTAAKERERDTRLMSLDAVTAAIAHEIGQPVAAVRLSAAAGLDWLNRKAPDSKMAVKSMRAAIEAADRIFDVINSIRETFSRAPLPLSRFSPNDMVRETAALLDMDLASRKITLQVKLDEAMPTILANRVQLQRVLVNLLTNAIESVSATRGRARRIEIRSGLEGDHVLIEVTDSGIGIAPEKIDQIFEPFVTTKSAGTGLGLWLSRTVVEEHGGRLWVSAGAKHGATFHLQLPLASS
jgi:signal transduction histidine kinase